MINTSHMFNTNAFEYSIDLTVIWWVTFEKLSSLRQIRAGLWISFEGNPLLPLDI